MPNQITDLTDRLTQTDQTGLDTNLLIPLLRLLVEGDPVTLQQLAAAAGRPIEDVHAGLALVPDTEYDAQGRVIGLGLTQRPTAHRFTVAGQELYTWCALDTLIFPTLLERAACVESISPVSGTSIRAVIDPAAGVTSVEPNTAVVSLVNPEQLASIRTSFCNQVHFFSSPEDAEGWLADHPGAEVVSVATAHQLATSLTTKMLDQLQAVPPGETSCHWSRGSTDTRSEDH
jgi:alkylmercury lyase